MIANRLREETSHTRLLTFLSLSFKPSSLSHWQKTKHSQRNRSKGLRLLLLGTLCWRAQHSQQSLLRPRRCTAAWLARGTSPEAAGRRQNRYEAPQDLHKRRREGVQWKQANEKEGTNKQVVLDRGGASIEGSEGRQVDAEPLAIDLNA